ncbi:unnamed protein product, partial [marine sediment metagenome]
GPHVKVSITVVPIDVTFTISKHVWDLYEPELECAPRITVES